MTLLQSILLGIIQGLTEFIPISSSGHLVIIPYLFGWEIPEQAAFIFDVLVQVATLLAIITYFWGDLIRIIAAMIQGLKTREAMKNPDSRTGWFLILATIPAGVLGFLLQDAVALAFTSIIATGIALLLTAILLIIAERVGKRNRDIEQLTWIDAIWIGFFQVLAIFPGLSRSGATIAGGMTRDLRRPASARFAFLMSLPIMLAAGVLATFDLLQVENLTSLLPVYIPGFITAAIVGYIAIRWLITYLNRHSLYIFVAYCAVVGSGCVLFGIFS